MELREMIKQQRQLNQMIQRSVQDAVEKAQEEILVIIKDLENTVPIGVNRVLIKRFYPPEGGATFGVNSVEIEYGVIE
jgi:hypothetical protein